MIVCRHCYYWAAALFFYFPISTCAEIQERHDHNGILTPYSGEPPDVVLTEGEIKKLELGKPIYKKIQIENARRGLAIFRVNAPHKRVWSIISDFKSYPEWIDAIKETEIYRSEGNHVYVRFTASYLLAGKMSWFVRHDYPYGNRNWGTWTLDYNHRSDMDDSVGFWRVIPVTGMPDKSDVIYSADLRLRGWIPAFVETFIVNQGLHQATQWVKQQSESGNFP